MSTHETPILRRLERLERQNRILKFGGLAALVVIGLGAAVRQKTGDYDVVRARRFEVVDEAGTTRGLLGMSGPNPVVRLSKDADSLQLSIEAQAEQTTMTLTAPDAERPGVQLNAIARRGLVQADILRGRLEGAAAGPAGGKD